MPTSSRKPVRRNPSADAVSKPVVNREMQESVNYHGSAILMLFVFVLLTSFAFALWMLKASVAQGELAMSLDAIASKITQNSAVRQSPSTGSVTDERTLVPGLYAHPKFCEPGFSGNCDDYQLYRVSTNGTNEVILESVRSLFPGIPLPLPVANSHDAREVVLSARRAGGEAAEIAYTYLVDTITGQVKNVATDLPDEAMYSPNNQAAVFVKKGADGSTSIVLVDLTKDTSKVIAKAKSGESFWNGKAVPSVKSFDGKSVSFDVFTPVDATHTMASLKETRTAKITP